MKKILFAIMVLCLLATPALAVDIAWELDDDHALATGYTIYFADGVGDYNYTFPATEAVIDGNMVKWGPIEGPLNLQPGTTYTFSLSRYNEWGQSGLSNEAVYATEAIDPYNPPADVLPEAIIYLLGPLRIITVE